MPLFVVITCSLLYSDICDIPIFHFGYDVYFGEALLSIAAILLFGFLATRHKRLVKNLMIALALLFSAGILICFGAAMVHAPVMTPSFVPDSSALSQITRIAIISPWAFIGFESISHRTEEFNFEHSKIHRVLVISVLSALLLYIAVTLLSVTAYPSQYASWLDYIRDLDHLSGIEALPAFYAAGRYLGNFGVVTLMVSLLALIITSLIGNITALSKGKTTITAKVGGKTLKKTIRDYEKNNLV